MPPKQQKSKEQLLGIEFSKSNPVVFGEWYQQVITKSEMIEYYDVSGCYILRPWSYSIWENIRDHVDVRIKRLGVQNSYFPLFVTKAKLETEKDHVAGFSPEVAWVTKSGQSDLQEPVAIRPTSETIMYPAFSNWIRSHRDLPLKLNQWSNVVRWEFKNPVPFLRTREFLWQEGHTCFSTLEEASEEVLQILDVYRSVYEDLLAVPVVKGKKTENEKFAGALYTTTVEAYIDANGRAIQGATSHCLGQNFSKMFRIEIEDEKGAKQLVWQNSWGLTTRTIGVMVMVHSDDKGLVLPPRVAPIQVVIIPLFFKDADTTAITDKAKEVMNKLVEKGVRCKLDDAGYRTPGWKYSHWELKGVPLRIEIGPKDLEKNQIMIVKRIDGTKQTISLDDYLTKIPTILEDIQTEMFEKAKKTRDERIEYITEWSQFVPALEVKKIVMAPFCEEKECEEKLKVKSGDESKALHSKKDKKEQSADQTTLTGSAKSLCIPFDQKPLPENAKCFCCGNAAKSWTLFGRSY